MRTFALLILTLSATPAFADYSFVCGKVRDKGPEKSEVAMVQDPESLNMKFYLNGKELPKDRFHETGAPDGSWNVSVFDEKDKDLVSARYQLREKPSQAQQFKAGQKDAKVGAAKKCTFVNTTEPAAPTR